VIAGADQLLVNGGPLLVLAGSGTRHGSTVGVVFAATMLVRAPVYVFQGFAASLLPNLTHLAARSGHEQLRKAVVRTAARLFALGLAFALVTALVGRAAMRLVYGAGFDAGAVSLALLAAGVACYLAASTFSQALLAIGRVRAAAWGWLAAAAVFVGSFAVLPGGPLLRVSAALVFGSVVGAAALGATLVRVAR
jgi:O-antigen/teichoic acid export membrane protein